MSGTTTPTTAMKRDVVVFSGGSAANNLVDVFERVVEGRGCGLSYIIPISDNGGSSSELIRVFGGPGIGDVRSRLIRLIPTTPTTLPLKSLFNHRLSPLPSTAQTEWHALVLGTHDLWHPIPSPTRELIRSFLNLLNLEIVKRARPSSTFNFQSASVGNLFLTGARLFSGSFESAIYLLGVVTGTEGARVEVVPSVNSNFSHHIAAGLTDGSVVVGQNEISHPSLPTAAPAEPPSHEPASPLSSMRMMARDLQHHDTIEDANLPGSLPSLRGQNIAFAKEDTPLLPYPIERIWYINPYGQEIRPSANPKVIESIRGSGAVIYCIGSLYTSIIPSLILRGVGDSIKAVPYKMLILNGCIDRETSSVASGPYTATDFIAAISNACHSSSSSSPSFSSSPAVPKEQFKTYVSHVIHLQGEGTPRVDKEELAGLGIECVRLYGRKNESGEGGMLYDGVALGQVIEAVMGRRDRGRRNTL
ncbi:hypothetical protein BJ875DRAFT_396892, partial [Amylocarpus encephaloides]